LPPFPDGVAHYLQWDVTTPLRPWEYWQQDAEEWTEAKEIQSAWKAGVSDADEERQED
jgi:hypothetical protein